MTITNVTATDSVLGDLEYRLVTLAPTDAEAARNMADLADWATNYAAALADTAERVYAWPLPGLTNVECLTCASGDDDVCTSCGAHIDWQAHGLGCGNAADEEAARELATIRGARRILADLARG